MAAALIQRISAQAVRTFSKPGDVRFIRENFKLLTDLMNEVKASDVNFDMKLVRDNGPFEPQVSHGGPQGQDVAPVTYINLYEDESFSMGIFILKHGTQIPLHDHPGMYGICRVIHGVATVKSYSRSQTGTALPDHLHERLSSWQRSLVVPVKLQVDNVFSPKDRPCVLTPEEGNFHEIKALSGPVAFVDILGPPYSVQRGRDCHYYKILATSDGPYVHENSQYLAETSQPSDFWCDTASYRGPKINPSTYEETWT